MEELINILKDIKPDEDFNTGQNLLADRILKSFDIVLLVSQISQIMDITIPANEIIPENFQTVESIFNLIERLKEE